MVGLERPQVLPAHLRDWGDVAQAANDNDFDDVLRLVRHEPAVVKDDDAELTDKPVVVALLPLSGEERFCLWVMGIDVLLGVAAVEDDGDGLLQDQVRPRLVHLADRARRTEHATSGSASATMAMVPSGSEVL